jgi:hypothetical protein
VRPNNRVPDGVAFPQLNLDPLAEGREHLGEDDLLVPHGRVSVLLHARAALKEEEKGVKIIMSAAGALSKVCGQFKV